MFCYPVSAYFAYIFSRNKLQLKEVIDAIARQCREWFPGATYHLMARGIRRMEIFEDEFDFQVFLKIMQQQSVNNDCRIHTEQRITIVVERQESVFFAFRQRVFAKLLGGWEPQ